MGYQFLGVILATESIQKAKKNETFCETTFLLVGGEPLDRGTLVACKNLEECKVCHKACNFWKILTSFFLGFNTVPSFMK